MTPVSSIRERIELLSPDGEDFAHLALLAIADRYSPMPSTKYSRLYPSMSILCTISDLLLREKAAIIAEIGEEMYRVVQSYLYKGSLDQLLWTRLFSSYPLGLSFEDRLIVRLCPMDLSGAERFFRGRGDRGEHIILQNGMRGCLGAAVAMIVSDRLGRYIIPEAMSLGFDSDLARIAQSNGFSTVETYVEHLEGLEGALGRLGPACVEVESGIGGHEVVVDGVLEEGVKLRDPYHGWQVIVLKEAFIRAAFRRGRVKLIQLGGPITGWRPRLGGISKA